MTNLEETSGLAAGQEVTQRWLPALLLLFVGSGCAALIYEVVWFQLLQLSIGSSTVSLAVLLGVFMGGMCLGSLLAPRYIRPTLHPLKVYAYLELGIGAFGLLVLVLVPFLGDLYTRIAGSGTVSVILRAVVASICLVPPTVLMGATLPAIARWVETTPRGVSWMGFFYGGNIAGAVAGSLLAGFYLLPLYDMPTATFAAVALNVLVAVLGLSIASITPQAAPSAPVPVKGRRPLFELVPGARTVYVAIALSGLTALGAQVVWTRSLSLLFGATAYTFSLILAVFLFGLGIGSSLGAAIGRNARHPRVALGWMQLAISASIAWAAWASYASLPYWPINPEIALETSYNRQLDLMRAVWVMLPGAILWGASFPLALAAVAQRGQDSASLVGGVYAANTVGAIVGALLTGLVLIGFWGSQVAQQVLIGVAALAGLLLLTSTAVGAVPAPVVIILAAIGAGLLVRSVPQIPGMLIAYGRYTATWLNQGNQVIYQGEGITASVAVTETPNGVRNYHNAGKVQASSEPQDMRLQRMLGHITTLVPESPSRVLVIGCGAGVTAGAVSIDPLVTNQTIAEIEPLVPKVVSTYFADHNFDVVNNPKVHVVFDDARHYLLTTKDKFDAITSDPLDPWVKGAATLYTREFFHEVKDHLNPGGVVTLFVQMYESTEDAVKSEIKTFLEAFPHGAVFANTSNGQGYDLVLYGQLDDDPIDVDAVQARLDDPANEAITQSLREIGIYSAVDLFGTYAGSTSDLENWLRDGEVNTDSNLRLQYLAGLGLNLYQADNIYRSMIRDARYPEHLFTGSPQTLQALRARIEASLGGAPRF